MQDSNYVSGIVKILEILEKKKIKNKISVVNVRVQLPQTRNTKIIKLSFWGNLADDVENYYKINDYVIVEGYFSFHDKKSKRLKLKISKQVQITVLKIYPFFLSLNSLPKNF